MIETIVHWLCVAFFGWMAVIIIAGVLPRPNLKRKRARRLIREMVQFYAASYVKGRITKDDFFHQARRLLIKSKYHSEYTGLWQSEIERYIEECTGHTPD